MSNERKWQKVTGPASWANSQLVPNGLTHQIAFDENSEGWVLVEEAGEPVGRFEQDGVSTDLAFIPAIDVANRVEDLIVHDEFRSTFDVEDDDEAGEEE